MTAVGRSSSFAAWTSRQHSGEGRRQGRLPESQCFAQKRPESRNFRLPGLSSSHVELGGGRRSARFDTLKLHSTPDSLRVEKAAF